MTLVRGQRPQGLYRVGLTVLVVIAGIAALVVGVLVAIHVVEAVAKWLLPIFGGVHPSG
jgi:hypothetical protein